MSSTLLQLPAKPEKMNRKGFIGGSDIAAILGISPWKTAYELWQEKTTDWQETSSEDRDKVLRRGKKLEPMVIEMLQEEHNVWVLERNRIRVDEEHPFLRAEIDFEYVLPEAPWVDGPPLNEYLGNGDIKTVHPRAAGDWGAEGTDEFPAYYGAQFQFGLMVTGRTHTKVGALIGADDLRIYEVDRDEEIIAFIRKAAVDFWFNHIIAGVPPGIQSSEDASKVLSRFEGFAWPGNEIVWNQLRDLKEVKAEQKVLEEKREALEIAVKTALATAATDKGVEGDSKKFTILWPDGKPACTWNEQSTGRIAVKLLRAEHPDLAEAFTETTKHRVLLTK